ncbi:MAG: hypothetical protein M3Y35_00755 [Actinomycetota bacterium]|nr:hypothetical protein [Actinomycetota bacterium]
MTITEPNTTATSTATKKVVKVPRSVVEGAKLQMTINTRLGLPTDPAVVKIAQAKPAR